MRFRDRQRLIERPWHLTTRTKINFPSPLHNNKAASKTVLILANFTVQCTCKYVYIHTLQTESYNWDYYTTSHTQRVSIWVPQVPKYVSNQRSKPIAQHQSSLEDSTVYTLQTESYNRKNHYYLHIWVPMAPISLPFGYGRLCNQLSDRTLMADVARMWL